MTLNNDTIELVCLLEEYVGRECFNPSSYNGYTRIEGLEYRYPVTITVTSVDGDEYTFSTKSIDPESKVITKKTVETMKYKFGANHLYIGQAIMNVLNALENRYGIDFNILERKYQENENKKSTSI